jgi:hypothetical protein
MFERLWKRIKAVQQVATTTMYRIIRGNACGHSDAEIAYQALTCGNCRRRGWERSMEQFGEWKSDRGDL